MERKRKLFWAKTGVLLSAIPVLLWAHEYGPDVGYSGVPEENGTCATSGCHVGTANNPNNKGSVVVNFPNGSTYTPGVKQHLTVTIADPSQQAWGFQLTARNAGSTSTMAGSFVPTDTHTLLMCGQPNLFAERAVCLSGADAGTPGTCAVSSSPVCPSGYSLQYIEHSSAGYYATRGQPNSATYEFDWTPPAASVGNITIYVAGNAANGDLTVNGDHIYTTTYTLTPAAGGGNGPTITDVENGASFQPGIVPGSWITIKGSNLSAVTDTWDNSIVDGKLPISLDGVSVTVGGQPAYIYYVSLTQINALVPNVGTGSLSVTVTNSAGTATATANALAVQPALFLWVNKYAVATHHMGPCDPQPYCIWAVANGTFAGITTTPAAPGETIVLWGTGFGPTDPAAPVGVPVPTDQAYVTVSPLSATVNGEAASVYQNQAFLAPTSAGEYQLAVTIPADAPDGDLPVVATINGAQSPTGVFITVHH
jgi:uncharacterized protein (TIGR03437 family)